MLDREKAVLVVVDIQEKLLPAIEDADGLRQRAVRLIQGAHLLGLPILVTEQYPQGLGPTDRRVAAALGDDYRPITKAAMSTLGDSTFREAWTAGGRRQILLCGIETHVCIYQTARDFRADSCAVFLAADCAGSRRRADHETGLLRMRQLGCCMVTHEMAVFEMLAVSGTPEFKQWVEIIR